MERIQYETVSTTTEGSPAMARHSFEEPKNNPRILKQFFSLTGVFLAGALLSWLAQGIYPVNDIFCNIALRYKEDTLSNSVQKFSSAAVASDQEPCSRLGRDALEVHGGNAVDAAVVVGLCLGVVNP